MKLVFPVIESEIDYAKRLTLEEAQWRALWLLEMQYVYGASPARNIEELRGDVHEVQWGINISARAGGGHFCAEEVAFILQPAAENL